MRIVVDYAQCESNALCVGAAPEVFAARRRRRPAPAHRASWARAPGQGGRGRPPLPKQALSIAEE